MWWYYADIAFVWGVISYFAGKAGFLKHIEKSVGESINVKKHIAFQIGLCGYATVLGLLWPISVSNLVVSMLVKKKHD